MEHLKHIFSVQVNVVQFMTTLPTCTMSWVSGESWVIIIITVITMIILRYGDVINIHHKQEDGWWVGECNDTVGIFPATYVETIWTVMIMVKWPPWYSFILTKKSLYRSSSFHLHIYLWPFISKIVLAAFNQLLYWCFYSQYIVSLIQYHLSSHYPSKIWRY